MARPAAQHWRRAAVAAVVLAALSSGATAAKASQAERTAMSAPFFLMDAQEMMCLRPDGFGVCDMDALWVQIPRGKKWQTSLVSLLEGDPKASCLERVGGGQESKVRAGSCGSSGAKRWEVLKGEASLYYLVEGMGKKRHCLMRGSTKDKARNIMSTQECRKGGTPLRREPTAINSEGFNLRTLDGKCFDGETFRTCSTYDRTQLFGLSIDFKGAAATRSFFHYGKPGSCVNRMGKEVQNGDCKGSGAQEWSLEDGMLMQNQNKYCLVRLADNSAEMRQCKEGVFEHMEMVVLTPQ